MEDQPLQSPPPSSPSAPSKTFLLILGAIVLMAISAVGGYYLGATKQPQTYQPINQYPQASPSISYITTPTSTSIPAADETVDEETKKAKSRNTQRKSSVYEILNAITNYSADNNGKIPAGITDFEQYISKDEADICTDLVPTFSAGLPIDDPKNPVGSGSQSYIKDCSREYNTYYKVIKNKSNNSITVSASFVELGEIISVTR